MSNFFYIALVQPLANGLVLFYKLFGNLGVAIIAFSVFLRIILNPLTKPYMESMKRMKDLAPQIEKLKAKYKGDKVKFAQAQADFYKEKKINPGAGCLPYLLQIVILIAFFNVFTRTLSPNSNTTANFNKVLYPQLQFKENETVNTKFIYLDVTMPDTFRVSYIPFALPGPILILAALIQLISSKAMMATTSLQQSVAKQTEGSMDDMQASMQKSMTYTFPLLTIFFGMSFPSGLALYWLLFSLLQIFQQPGFDSSKLFGSWTKRLGLVKSVASEHGEQKRKQK